MTVDCKIIDLPFNKFNNNPFCIYFVYTPEQNFIIKGLSDDVVNYLKNNIQQYVCKWTMWQDGKVRAEGFSSSHSIFIKKTKTKSRSVYNVLIFNKDNNCNNLLLRNFPKKWIPEYNIAKKRIAYV